MSVDSELLPGWAWATVEEVMTDCQYGSSAKTNEDSTGVPVLRMGNIQAGQLDLGTLKYLPASHAEFPALLLHPGDLLFNRTNSAELVGKTAVYTGRPSPCSFASYLVRLHLSGACLPKYLCFYLNSQAGRRWVASVVSQQVGQANVNSTKLRALRFPLAPTAEQQRILEKVEELFSDLDAGVAALERARANLKKYRAAVLKAAVTGELTADWRAAHPDAEPATKLLDRVLAERRRKWEADQQAKFAANGRTPPKNWQEKYANPVQPETAGLPEVPPGWCWATMDMLAALAGGITKGQKRKPDDRIREVLYLRVANVQRGYLDLSEMKSIEATAEEIAELRLREGDILFNEGGDRDKLGRGWVWRGEVKECIHQNHVFRARLFSDAVNPEFISHHGNTFGQEWFSRAGKQSVNLASINLSVLRRFPVPIPPADEQQAIISVVQETLSDIDATANYITASLKRAGRLRQSILKEAFAGRLVPQDPSDEPASQLLERVRTAAIHRPKGHGTSAGTPERRAKSTRPPE